MRPARMLGWMPHTIFDSALSRRRFLKGIGLVAGAGVLAPVLSQLGRRATTRIDETRPLLGTWVRVVARHSDPQVASRAVRSAFAAVERVDRVMSIHRDDSDVTRVNRASGAALARVPAALLDVVALARDGAERTDGIYDPSVLPLLRTYGFYGPARDAFPTDREIARAEARVGWRSIVLDRHAGTLGLSAAGAALDLGSIGKGWAVDRAIDALRAAGIRDGMVDAGGNLYAMGESEPGANGWTVGVYHPVSHAVDRVFLMRDQAIATSGNYEQYRILAGRRVGHLFDARTGRPADGRLSATVLADDATRADLMSTVSFLLGPGEFHWPEARAVHWIG